MTVFAAVPPPRPGSARGGRPTPSPLLSAASADRGIPRPAAHGESGKFEIQDPLKHGSLSSKRLYVFPEEGGPATLDISKINGKRPNWQKIDSFLTPKSLMQELHAVDYVSAGGAGGNEAAVAAAAAAAASAAVGVMGAFMEEVRGEFRAAVVALREDIASAVNQTVKEIRADVRASKSSNESPDRYVSESLQPMLEELKEARAVLSKQLQQLGTSIHQDLVAAQSAWLSQGSDSPPRVNRRSVDFGPVLEEIRKMKSEPEAILAELRDLRAVVERCFEFQEPPAQLPLQDPKSPLKAGRHGAFTSRAKAPEFKAPEFKASVKISGSAWQQPPGGCSVNVTAAGESVAEPAVTVPLQHMAAGVATQLIAVVPPALESAQGNEEAAKPPQLLPLGSSHSFSPMSLSQLDPQSLPLRSSQSFSPRSIQEQHIESLWLSM